MDGPDTRPRETRLVPCLAHSLFTVPTGHIGPACCAWCLPRLAIKHVDGNDGVRHEMIYGRFRLKIVCLMRSRLLAIYDESDDFEHAMVTAGGNGTVYGLDSGPWNAIENGLVNDRRKMYMIQLLAED